MMSAFPSVPSAPAAPRPAGDAGVDQAFDAGHAEAWTTVCRSEVVRRGLGVVALVRGRQVALLRDDDGGLHAIDNRDPFTGANVLARGLVEEVDGVLRVASPLRKQRFDLATGRCLDDPSRSVARHDVVEVDGRVRVRLAPGDARVADDTFP